jgi:hypothetical protein
MDALTLLINVKILRRASDADEYGLYKATLEGGSTNPIIISSHDESEARRKTERPSTVKFQKVISFCRRLPAPLLADDVGLAAMKICAERRWGRIGQMNA